MDPELIDCILTHLVARARDHVPLITAIRQDYLRQDLHSVEREKRQPHWNGFADAVNHLTGTRRGGLRD